ncbi:Flp family type IVb pilin [Novosphingobium album (ex Liu et al. 2023)]|uniref:Flp family type IVb pilin n=1 Tax=Novosphingobium album (ex Liu et al. 2023) TaxID=3031130 RepID=A0ABT5WWW3_9SPHN|nr:Flp family type IVb pilin [Novosphingobium album (ex Liu et al. 2023)]MDE8654352.1 Flp family type IVb pilin [Novosphingobium album (ex Liu et al. 2023)]
MSFITILKELRKDDRGASAVEFGLICAMIVLGLIAAVRGVAEENSKMWNFVSDTSREATSK